MLALIGCSVMSSNGSTLPKKDFSADAANQGIVKVMLKEAKSDPNCYQLITSLQDMVNGQSEGTVSYAKNFDKNTHERGGYNRGGFDRNYSRENFSKTNFDKDIRVALNISDSKETKDKVLKEVNNRIEIFKNRSLKS